MSAIMSQLDESIDHRDIDHHGVGSNFTDSARAELSALRARVSELEAQTAQQAAQLEQARDHFNAISKMPPHFTDATAISEAIVIARDWLSSNPVSQSEEH